MNKQKNIIILDSHYKTRTFLECFKNYKISLVYVNPYEKKLSEKYENISNYLDISDISFFSKKNHKNQTNIFEKYDLSFSYFISLDRRLKLFSEDLCFNYLNWVGNSYINFLFKNKFDKNSIIFMEPTWAHEILIAKISLKLNLIVSSAMKCKIFPNRFYYFEGFLNEKIFTKNHNQSNKKYLIFGNRAVNLFLKMNSSKSIYNFNKMAKKNKLNLFLFQRLFLLFREKFNRNYNIFIHNSLFHEVIKKFLSILRFHYLLIYKNFWSKFNDKDNHIKLYFPLHFQPEASIDVLGNKFRDQIKFIKAISNQIKDKNIILYVKEHPHFVGNRKLSFYKNIKRLQNVKLLNPWLDGRKILINFDLVISITGTAVYESSFYGAPSVCAVKMYFSSLLIKSSFDPNKDSILSLLNLIPSWKKFRKSELWTIELGKIIINSHKGNFGDILNDSHVFEKSNLMLLERSLHSILK